MPSVVLSVRTAKSWYDRLQAGDIRGVMNSISKAIDVSEEYGYGVTAWSVDDVLAEADERGIVLTEEDAKNFLAKIEYRIMEDSVDRGWDLIGDLLTAEFGASKD
jgi:hypothetical protein